MTLDADTSFLCLTSYLQIPCQTLFFSGCLRSFPRRMWPRWSSPCASVVAPRNWSSSGPGTTFPLRPSMCWPCGGGGSLLLHTSPKHLSWHSVWPRVAGQTWPESCCCGRRQPPGSAHCNRKWGKQTALLKQDACSVLFTAQEGNLGSRESALFSRELGYGTAGRGNAAW